ncbi:MAG: cobalamin-dependent protein [Thiogranum sp.]|nr:cobalamin-dependent protein [Thiogranum sp.]
MRVLLVSANRERIPDPIFPLGLAYVGAAARQAGHEVRVADLCFGRAPLQALTGQVRRFQPDVVGLSLRNVDNAAYPRTVDYLDQHRAVVDVLRGLTTAPVVLGGSGFSIIPQAYMQALDGDWGIAGEGEVAFVRLLAALQDGRKPDGIAGLFGRDGPASSSGGEATVPLHHRGWPDGCWPARDLLDYSRYIRRGGMGNVQTKRGCVFKCSYCTYPLLEGNRFRTRDAADVVDEIEALMQDYGPHPVFFVDSILNFPRNHVETICEEILRRGVKVRWSCYATPVKLDRHQARLMAAAGCDGIELGTDAVDDDQLSRLGKSFDAETAIKANLYCMEAGLRVCQTLIFGAPGETQASVRATCAAVRRMNPTAVVAMTGVRLYPGTPLTNSLIAQGRVAKDAIGLLPAFYVEPEVAGFLPRHLQMQAYQAGNWVLPGLAAPILPGSQRLLRGLGISGPLWRLLQSPWMHALNRSRFKHPNTSWGVPHPGRKVV